MAKENRIKGCTEVGVTDLIRITVTIAKINLKASSATNLQCSKDVILNWAFSLGLYYECSHQFVE